MTREMSHEEASESLAAAALDALPADEQAAVLAHASTCPECGPELDSLRQALATLGNATPVAPTPPPPDVELRLQRIRGRLLARAQADRAPRAPRRIDAFGWVALAAAIVLAVLLVNQRAGTARVIEAANLRAAAESASLDTARAQLASRDREMSALTGPTTSVVGLNTTGAAEATALMFWDKTNNSWAFYGHHLPPLPVGKTYQLWLLTPSSKISAGTFTPAADSSVEVHATYALPRDALKGVAVSEEPSGGVPQPTGRIVIIGTPGAK
jgi:anti-sigma-K factor RskA